MVGKGSEILNHTTSETTKINVQDQVPGIQELETDNYRQRAAETVVSKDTESEVSTLGEKEDFS